MLILFDLSNHNIFFALRGVHTLHSDPIFYGR